MLRKWVPLLAASTLVLAACGGGDDEAASGGSGGGSGELRQVTAGLLPVAVTGALQGGIEQGFFEDRGIEVTIETGQGGAALLPAVASGEMQFATSNPVSLLQARDQGLDVRVVGHWTSTHAEGEDVNGVVADKDSGITSAAGLAGKRIAVNTLNGMGQLTIDEAVRQDGGDPSGIQYVELGFPDMPAALEAGNVDAVWVPEPFLSQLIAAGHPVASYSSQESVPGHPTQLFFTSGQLVESDPQLVEDFTAALEETLEWADANPDAVRTEAEEFLQTPAGSMANVRIEEFGTDLRREQIEQMGELMVDAGLLDNDPDIDGLLPEE
ncbi:ABC transporter substrate-binding protein [Geodermatophilus sabuli]|uniref:NitT/TauT family transport system substrate-binding protein n=1 Tax=Geodermatophilus sabuli TaxID=1564158 RepID=A0A285EJQ6_9ACTN|nr:ABC transporter substrate-binding protein [Geodermatophilus sabuli]MBB3087034.1 NitT/TauT family transport system substrate-binding protein [Geodermatophilus sabuli]SNX99372.1 NitT/TauT family transport system substrate-binding protein [Geodermatophilus sabuli]